MKKTKKASGAGGVETSPFRAYTIEVAVERREMRLLLRSGVPEKRQIACPLFRLPGGQVIRGPRISEPVARLLEQPPKKRGRT